MYMVRADFSFPAAVPEKLAPLTLVTSTSDSISVEWQPAGTGGSPVSTNEVKVCAAHVDGTTYCQESMVPKHLSRIEWFPTGSQWGKPQDIKSVTFSARRKNDQGFSEWSDPSTFTFAPPSPPPSPPPYVEKKCRTVSASDSDGMPPVMDDEVPVPIMDGNLLKPSPVPIMDGSNYPKPPVQGRKSFLSSDGMKLQWAHTTGNEDGVHYDVPPGWNEGDMAPRIHLKAPEGMVITLESVQYDFAGRVIAYNPLNTGFNEITDLHAYLLQDVPGCPSNLAMPSCAEYGRKIFYMSESGHVWDHWDAHFLAWAEEIPPSSRRLQSGASDDTALDLRHLDVNVCTDGSFAFTLKAFTNGDSFGGSEQDALGHAVAIVHLTGATQRSAVHLYADGSFDVLQTRAGSDNGLFSSASAKAERGSPEYSSFLVYSSEGCRECLEGSRPFWEVAVPSGVVKDIESSSVYAVARARPYGGGKIVDRLPEAPGVLELAARPAGGCCVSYGRGSMMAECCHAYEEAMITKEMCEASSAVVPDAALALFGRRLQSVGACKDDGSVLCPLCKSHGASKMEFINYLVRETAGSPDIVYTDTMAEAAFDAYCIDSTPGPIADGNWPQPGGGQRWYAVCPSEEDLEAMGEQSGDPCSGKACGDTCVVQGDMAGMCDSKGACSFEYDNLGCAPIADGTIMDGTIAPPADYIEVTTGVSCAESGHGIIWEKDECSAAAAALGLSDVTATSYSNGGPPSGCFYSDNEYMPYLGNLVINTDGRMMGSCSTTNRCICVNMCEARVCK